MPSALHYVAPTDIDRNQFGAMVSQERQARRNTYRTAVDYYEGTHPDQLETLDDNPDDNVIINLVKMTADRTVSFLFPDIPTFEIDPDTIEPTPEETFITDFFEANGGLAALSKLALRGFLSGHVYIRVKPAPQELRAKKLPKMILLDPNYVNVYWRADDVADVLWYELRYIVGNIIRIQDFVYVEKLDSWAILTYEGKRTGGSTVIADIPTVHGSRNNLGTTSDIFLDGLDFGRVDFKLISTAIHESSIPPIIDFPHLPNPDDYFGASEASQKTLQDSINRIASEMNKIVRENADPVDVLLGADLDDVQDSGGIISIATLGAKVQRLEMKGDLTGIKTMLEKLIETYLAVARVVLLKGEAKDLQRVTNASVRTLFLDALAKNAILRSTYGSNLARVAKLALQMGYESGHVANNPEDLAVTVHFGEPLPTDMSEVANINAIQVNMGARSKRTAATKMGDRWAFEQDAMASEQAQDLEAQRAGMELMQEFQPDETSNDEPTP